jgi:small-conductance mechanosensitive channel
MVLALALLIAAVLVRSASTNRHVRGRLLVSAVMFGFATLFTLALRFADLPGPFRDEVQLIEPLLIAFGAINAVVALAINPWKGDRLPDRFPTIVQDAIAIGLFAIVAGAVLQERIFAATAVSAVVLGLALQDTLGNLFAGLAIQIEKPFRVGDWVGIRGEVGMVSQITWRATKMRTKAGNFVVVPNAVLSKDTIVNYSEPIPETRIEFELGVSYDVPPNQVKATILAVVRDESLVARTPPPDVLLVDYAPSRVTYRVRMWTKEFGVDDPIKDRVRTAIYYAFSRNNIAIPFPTQTVVLKEASAPVIDRAPFEQLLGRVSIFAALADAERAQIAAGAKRRLYAAGEAIVRQNEPGNSMFVLLSGEAAVLLAPGNEEVARVTAGGFFGEMSLLTGAPRSATVRTTIDSEVLEITADAFREFVLANPSAVETVGVAVARRQAELDQRRAHASAEDAHDAPQGFLDRMRRFLGLAGN